MQARAVWGARYEPEALQDARAGGSHLGVPRKTEMTISGASPPSFRPKSYFFWSRDVRPRNAIFGRSGPELTRVIFCFRICSLLHLWSEPGTFGLRFFDNIADGKCSDLQPTPVERVKDFWAPFPRRHHGRKIFLICNLIVSSEPRTFGYGFRFPDNITYVKLF